MCEIFKFELGETVKDKITSFQGVVMVRSQFLTGCIHYGVCSQDLKAGKMTDWEWIDSKRLIRVATPKVILETM